MVAASALAACTPVLPTIGGDPTVSPAVTSPITYRSPFTGYVRMDLVEPRPWRATNDRVRDLGGSDAQMKDESDEAPAPSSKPQAHP